MMDFVEKAFELLLLAVAAILALMFASAAILAIIIMWSSFVNAQEHHMHHGKQADADWYEAACCNDEDCRIIDPATVTYDAANRTYLWKSDLSGKLHAFHEDNISAVDYKPKIRLSKDFNTHGCERNTADKPGDADNWVGYCLYLSNAM
jgi:hypothetical protein